MAIINKNGSYVALPSAFKRGNAIALDTTSLWYSYSEMETYAASNPTAYVGQILTLVDIENSNKVSTFVINNESGELSNLGSGMLADDKTIMLDEAGTAALKNWGIEYYKWISPIGKEGSEKYIAGHYEKHVLVEGETWPINLTPKSSLENGVVELAWYEPSGATIEEIEDTIVGIQSEVQDIQATIPNLISKEGGTLEGDLILSDGNKAISEIGAQKIVNEAILSAGHLTREIVNALPSIEEADPNVIYMIVRSQSLLNNFYDEYMFIDGTFEKIGDTSVNLDSYVTDAELTEAIAPISELSGTVLSHIENLEIHISADERAKWDKTVEDIAALVKISQNDADKLANLPAIKLIGDNLSLSDDGVLSAVISSLPIASSETLGGIKIGSGLAIDALTGLASIDETILSKINSIPEDAQANIVEGALLGNSAALINEQKQIVIPIANSESLGLVKSSEENNKISVNKDGTMEVTNVSTSNLYVPENEELVLCGGTSTINI